MSHRRGNGICVAGRLRGNVECRASRAFSAHARAFYLEHSCASTYSRQYRFCPASFSNSIRGVYLVEYSANAVPRLTLLARRHDTQSPSPVRHLLSGGDAVG